ncbi:MAG: YihY/virulence factor BrkB family protein [Phenylobacterium sp.]|nr:YihY/virulence factor BrkB family protein [Phenylobacterium sp.]
MRCSTLSSSRPVRAAGRSLFARASRLFTPRPRGTPSTAWDIALRTWKAFFDDQMPMIAAGVTFYTLLAIFPGVAAFVAIWGLFADVTQAQQHLQRLSGLLPGEAITLIGAQMANVSGAGHSGLSLAAVTGLVVSLWSANGAMMAVITGLNFAYGETESRRYRRKLLVSFGFTFGFLAFVMIVASVLVAQAATEAFARREAAILFALIAWPLLFVLFVSGLALLYRYGPSRRPARWRWLSGGGAIAGALWLAASAGFSLYVGAFGDYNRIYGPLGATIAFMTWTWVSSMAILLGAVLNAEMNPATRVQDAGVI